MLVDNSQSRRGADVGAALVRELLQVLHAMTTGPATLMLYFLMVLDACVNVGQHDGIFMTHQPFRASGSMRNCLCKAEFKCLRKAEITIVGRQLHG